MDQRCGRTEPDPCSGSCDAHVLRASQLQHSVQHVGRDGHLARLSPVCLRMQPIADDALQARDIGLQGGSDYMTATLHLVTRMLGLGLVGMSCLLLGLTAAIFG